MSNRWERNVRPGNEKPIRLTERDNSYGENCRIHNAMIRLGYYYCCYYGYQSPDEDIDCLNWMTKMSHWDQVRTATVMYHRNQNPVLAMINSPVHWIIEQQTPTKQTKGLHRCQRPSVALPRLSPWCLARHSPRPRTSVHRYQLRWNPSKSSMLRSRSTSSIAWWCCCYYYSSSNDKNLKENSLESGRALISESFAYWLTFFK